jgi:hypothetical protein
VAVGLEDVQRYGFLRLDRLAEQEPRPEARQLDQSQRQIRALGGGPTAAGNLNAGTRSAAGVLATLRGEWRGRQIHRSILGGSDLGGSIRTVEYFLPVCKSRLAHALRASFPNDWQDSLYRMLWRVTFVAPSSSSKR